ncbi:MAG: Holliday junction resolvase RuvX [candidate division KSB1 bacterium]|nr:Holliday junction resolvase RuvX [candidate division KSB1 bacterium]MDZ7333897.1 Holliday junction resolvase RuvX [candidate division KSB1 bacterium]MDZ7358342.1 Holliday junction resolvase RuvX [candidate division KSB1 bacterium]MDZ7399143.1 Holliday junction resolvase RuvX [candidate division KSB1 bacterium]
MNTTGRILGIDYGVRRLGVAISDPMRTIAQGLPTIKISGLQQMLAELEAIIIGQQVTEIVVGWPLNLKGEATVAAQQVDRFIQQLQQRFHLPIHRWDERWSSIEAQRTIHQFDKSPSRLKAKVDQIAAILILQSFLDYLRIQNQNRNQEQQA